MKKIDDFKVISNAISGREEIKALNRIKRRLKKIERLEKYISHRPECGIVVVPYSGGYEDDDGRWVMGEGGFKLINKCTCGLSKILGVKNNES